MISFVHPLTLSFVFNSMSYVSNSLSIVSIPPSHLLFPIHPFFVSSIHVPYSQSPFHPCLLFLAPSIPISLFSIPFILIFLFLKPLMDLSNSFEFNCAFCSLFSSLFHTIYIRNYVAQLKKLYLKLISMMVS